MKAFIFCSGEVDNLEFLRGKNFDKGLIICADGGLQYANLLGITPDAIIGDNDSWESKYPECAEVMVHPKKKDYTDSRLCVDYAIAKGCTEIEIIGGFGGRRDHEYAHYCLMAYALEKGVKIVMSNSRNDIWMENKPFNLEKTSRKYVSFFPYGGDVNGFSVKGLKYSAKDIVLTCESALAASNEFTDKQRAEITFNSGRILVIISDDKVQ